MTVQPGEDDQMRVATSRYQNGQAIVESGLAPVRITIGAPRFRLPYTLAGTLLALAPDQTWMRLADRDQFEPLMVAKLFSTGPTQIREMIEALGTGYSGVVLLCYEQIPGPEWCHRTMVAEWLNTQLGWSVEELKDLAPPPRPRDVRRRNSGTAEQRKLFEMPVGEASKRVVEKASMLVLTGKVQVGIGGAYIVEASTGPHGYNVTIDPPSCECRWGMSEHESACSHLLAARYVDEYGLPPQVRASNG